MKRPCEMEMDTLLFSQRNILIYLRFFKPTLMLNLKNCSLIKSIKIA